MQTQTDQINVRIDTGTKTAAEDVFNRLGISATDAVRMFYRQVVMHRGLPFEARLIISEEKKEEGKNMVRVRKAIKKAIEKNKVALSGLAKR